ncbi:ABC transporter ATP-binding protein [Microlunatus endophyticus]|uniref:ABC transporter ATP-binding protein n=2 Tax=Microlunatus endophyticus TaxID=1716077 RepID=A0A917S6A7_9ACTN|nr:ABC transporter ATP-binding protein [Microlunatus endophyticus]
MDQLTRGAVGEAPERLSHNGGMGSDTPRDTPRDNPRRERDSLARSAFRRSARLASLPLGYAGRRTLGLGRRIGGATADSVNEELRARTADQLFRVLGELKGGAMKVGQMMSMMESYLPDEVAAPYREKLSMLRDSAPPMPTSRVHAVLARELGPDWRSNFERFDPRPAAAASIGQVHRAAWADGREVAVKVQYPGADEALRADLRQLGRMAAIAGPLAGGMNVREIAEEFAARIDEELDYRLEAESQQAFADGLDGDPEFFVPNVVAHTPRVLISEWVEGVPLTTIADWETEPRNEAGLKYVRFLFAGPSRVGLLHADPHPGNFKVLPDGRLGAVDFGLIARLPDGLPSEIGRILRIAMSGDDEAAVAGLRREGFLTQDVDAEMVMDYLRPFVEPAQADRFSFTRAWTQQIYRDANEDSVAAREFGRAFNLPTDYLLIHRVWMGGIAVLSQLGITADFHSVLDEFLPGFAPEPA